MTDIKLTIDINIVILQNFVLNFYFSWVEFSKTIYKSKIDTL